LTVVVPLLSVEPKTMGGVVAAGCITGLA